MSQNHTTFDGIPGWDQIDNQALNTMGQYHGNTPWYSKFGVQKGIRDFEHAYPHVYATSPHKNCVYANPECIRRFPSQK